MKSIKKGAKKTVRIFNLVYTKLLDEDWAQATVKVESFAKLAEAQRFLKYGYESKLEELSDEDGCLDVVYHDRSKNYATIKTGFDATNEWDYPEVEEIYKWEIIPQAIDIA